MSIENTTTNIQNSTGTGASVPEVDVQRQVNFPQQQEKQKEIKMADVDTSILAGQHADIRREAAINAADIRKEGVENTAAVRRDVMFEGQENVNATKDARHDILALTIPTIEGQAATSVIAGGGMGYIQLLEARDRFKRVLISASSHYRICVEEENE